MKFEVIYPPSGGLCQQQWPCWQIIQQDNFWTSVRNWTSTCWTMLWTPCTMILGPRWGSLFSPLHVFFPHYRTNGPIITHKTSFFRSWFLTGLDYCGVSGKIYQRIFFKTFLFSFSKELLKKSLQTSRTIQMPGQGLTPFWSSLRTWKRKYVSCKKHTGCLSTCWQGHIVTYQRISQHCLL